MRGFKRLAVGWFAFSMIALWVAAGSQRVRADSLDINPNPNTITCECGQTLGSLEITAYGADNPGTNGPGATLVAQFTQSNPACNLQLEWIQVIVGGVGTIGQTLGGNGTIPYLDPYKRDDNLPFYWTTVENGTVGTGRLNAGAQAGTLFSDAPSQPATNGNSIHFETALVAVSCTNPLDLYWLAGFTWGYSIADGTSTIDPFAWTTGPSADMTTAVTDFDGTTNYVGDGSTEVNNDTGGIGYTFVSGCPTCCNCVPLPGAAWMGLAGLLVLGTVLSARAKFARAAA